VLKEPPPLRKRRSDGTLYTRRPLIERHIHDLSNLSQDEFVRRAAIRDRRHADYVPSEVVMYRLRATKQDNHSRMFEQLYRIIRDRIVSACPRTTSMRKGEPTEAISLVELRDKVVDQVIELIVLDRDSYQERLDIYEVVFDRAVASRRLDAYRKHYQDASTREDLEVVDEAEASEALDDPSARDMLQKLLREEGNDDRIDLQRAIDALPNREQKVIIMILAGYKIESQDSNEVTISSSLKCTPKTARTRRDSAIGKLRTLLEHEASHVA
jgi:DNA-directed RNA polymerase specialized sigma24 family protein